MRGASLQAPLAIELLLSRCPLSVPDERPTSNVQHRVHSKKSEMCVSGPAGTRAIQTFRAQDQYAGSPASPRADFLEWTQHRISNEGTLARQAWRCADVRLGTLSGIRRWAFSVRCSTFERMPAPLFTRARRGCTPISPSSPCTGLPWTSHAPRRCPSVERSPAVPRSIREGSWPLSLLTCPH